MNHTASARFWRCYHSLPVEVRALADKNFELLKADPGHLLGWKAYVSVAEVQSPLREIDKWRRRK